jgi:glutamate-1-semialdehyde 2,1-aminomutase
VIPGGVNTSLRIIEPPLAFVRAAGSKVYDADGTEYIDYHLAFGPIILGHCHPEVNARIWQAMQTLDLIGAGTTSQEAELASRLVRHIPSAEAVLFCNSGSEATYHAVRLARAVTGRRRIVKFQGCYHGWHDYLLMNVITPAERMGHRDPLSAGMLAEAVEATTVLPFNDANALEETLGRHGDEIAAVILEPIAHNIGCVPASPEFLQALRHLTRQRGIVLIFDEVVTGFRHHRGGYQAICGVTPDLTALGKAIANGFPLAALVGRRDLMIRFNTAGGDVFFAGTYNAHPWAMAAGLATLDLLEDGEIHRRLFREGERLRTELAAMIDRLGLPAHVAGFGSVWLVYFLEPPVRAYNDLLRNNTAADLAFRRGLIARGIFSLPLALKRNHLSAAHTPADVDRTLQAAEDALRALRAMIRPNRRNSKGVRRGSSTTGSQH